MRRYLLIVVTILCACLQAVAQEPVRDSLEVLAEPVAMQAEEPIPTAVQPEPVKPATRSVDTTVYQGVIVRLDIANPIFELARSSWHTYAVEAAVSVRLKYRLFPTIELGYAGQFRQEKDATTPKYNGQGEYVRLGMDISPLKKHPERRSVMLVGVRAGVGWQQLEPTVSEAALQGAWIADAWGEIVAGVQVDIYKGFNMGWAVRMKFLFTEKTHDSLTIPYYIPGFGYRNSMNWGLEYYLGYAF